MWALFFTKNAEKDRQLLKQAGLDAKARKLLDILVDDPFQNPPSYEKLVGDLRGYYSRRINIQHRLVYRVDAENKIVIVHSMWSHYEK
jgi:toxin YoeB